MINRFSKFLDHASEYLARRKGLLPLTGIGLILINLLLVSILPPDWYLVRSNLLLHIGLIVSLFGLILSKAL
jgi:hypothetical protein